MQTGSAMTTPRSSAEHADFGAHAGIPAGTARAASSGEGPRSPAVPIEPIEGNWFVRKFCMLACFPYAYYARITNWSDRCTVLLRGFSVMFSPIVGLASLLLYGTAVLGIAPLIILLPFVAGVVDWKNMSLAWEGNSQGRWGRIGLRVAICFISVMVALYGSVIAESQNLLASLREHEQQQALQDPSINERWSLYAEQIGKLQERRNANEGAYRQRGDLVRELSVKQNLAEKEARGMSGRDAATGVFITGNNKCGPRCESYKADARALQTQIEELDRLPAENQRIDAEIASAEKARAALISDHLSEDASVGTLLESLQFAGYGTLTSIVFKCASVLLMELLALVFALGRSSANLVFAKQLEEKEDAFRVKNYNKERNAQLAVEHARTRAEFGASHSPVVVEIVHSRAGEFVRSAAGDDNQ